MFNLLKIKKKPVPFSFPAVASQDPEDASVIWMELPDHLRLKFVDGKYVGWYSPMMSKEG